MRRWRTLVSISLKQQDGPARRAVAAASAIAIVVLVALEAFGMIVAPPPAHDRAPWALPRHRPTHHIAFAAKRVARGGRNPAVGETVAAAGDPQR
jgi:hypothetical protein